jgi:hypothetical protein
MIRDVRLAGKIDGNDLLRLVVVERLEHGAVEVFDVEGSICRRIGILGWTFGQGVSLWVVSRNISDP